MKIKILTFVLTLALWFVFAGKVNIQVLLLGSIICSLVSLKLPDTVFRLVQKKYVTKAFFLKLYYIYLVVSAFIYDVFLSAFRVSKHAFERTPSISSRMVRIETSLGNLNSIAVFANFITLPRGSLAIDIDNFNRDYRIHWIDVHSDEEAEIKKARIRKHENLIAKIFD
ncbi:cation transporter [Bacillus sp. HMF5848]|uniref:Na+/H+ antiporter subunit E n=1 Tax=Bacillus sp. HMF5848 TaxID=2495421 RepID=UPI000F77984B|nr:Na+/H+ antiporter subunit E [Bacillus sp. HMF5848]RSK25826.1 cation transporter [Bacillus sp. HMF5848]